MRAELTHWGSYFSANHWTNPSGVWRAWNPSSRGCRSPHKGTTEAHLQTRWRLLAGGQVVSDTPRHEMMRDTINHWAHHRGQMTVYLRLMGAPVPALYGPSADDKRFA